MAVFLIFFGFLFMVGLAKCEFNDRDITNGCGLVCLACGLIALGMS